MSKTKYQVKHAPDEDFSDIAVFIVNGVSVWVTRLSDAMSYVACTRCQSLMCGMSGSCVHAQAVKRHLKKHSK